MKIKTLRFVYLFILCFLFCFKAFSEKDQGNSGLSNTFRDSPLEANKESSDSSILPVKKDEPLLKYVEISRFNIKVGVKNLFTRFADFKVWQFPALLEFQVPILTASGNVRWLAEAGGGWMELLKESQGCSEFFHGPAPKPPAPPFDDEFFQRIYRTKLNEYEENCIFKAWDTVYSFPYMVFQTGLQYNFQPLTLSLLGGTVVGFGGPQTMGFTGSVLLGWNISDVFYLDLGAEYLHYDRDYIGFSVSMGFTLKKWWEKVYFK